MTIAFLITAGLAALVLMSTASLRLITGMVVLSCGFSRLTFEIGPADIRPEHVVAVTLALAAFVRFPSRWMRALRSTPSLGLGALITWGLLTSVLNGLESSVYAPISGWLVIDWLLMVSIAAADPPREALLRATRLIVIFGGLSAVVFWLLAMRGTDAGGVQFSGGSTPAAYGFSHEANVLAAVLAIGALVVMLTEPRLWAARALLPLGSAIAGILVAQTRAAIIALAAASALLALSKESQARKRGQQLVVAAAVMAPLVLAVNPAILSTTLLSKFTFLFDFSEANASYRLRLISLAMSDLRAEPEKWLFGFGVNSFGESHYDPSRPGELEKAYLGNLPVQLLYDVGLVGIGFFLVVLVSLRLFGNSDSRAIFVCAFLISLSTSVLWFAPVWLLAGVRVSQRLNEADAASQDEPAPRGPTTVYDRSPARR